MKTTIENLFNIYWGQKEYHNKENLNEGNTLLISSSGINNGCYGFFDAPVKFSEELPFITVPSTGSIGIAFVQDVPCCVDDDCLILIPKEKMNITQLYQIAYQIRKNKWRYNYGRKITPYRLNKQIVVLADIKGGYETLTKELMPKERTKVKIPEHKNIRMVKLVDLCNIDKKQGIPVTDISEGKTPYVSSSSLENGVIAFTEEKPNAKAKTLTVAKDGNDGYSFFQPYDYLTSIHNYILTLKDDLPEYVLLYIGAVIKKRAYCYNHYYPLDKAHLERFEIPMPFKNGSIDIEHIMKIVENSYAYDEFWKLIG